MKLENGDWIKFFTSMEQKRFDDLEDIKQYLKKQFKGAKVILNFKSYVDDDFFPNDYEIVCEIQKDDEYLIDLDLYFLYDRKNMLYITEFGAEEQ